MTERQTEPEHVEGKKMPYCILTTVTVDESSGHLEVLAEENREVLQIDDTERPEPTQSE